MSIIEWTDIPKKYGFSTEDITDARRNKNDKRGSFDENVFLIEAEEE